MKQLNIAIFGSSGAIGEALCVEYANKENIENVFAFKS